MDDLHEATSHLPAPEGHAGLPGPTPWPAALGLGMTLALAGLVTHLAISGLGLFMILVSVVMLVREDIRMYDSEVGDQRSGAWGRGT